MPPKSKPTKMSLQEFFSKTPSKNQESGILPAQHNSSNAQKNQNKNEQKRTKKPFDSAGSNEDQDRNNDWKETGAVDMKVGSKVIERMNGETKFKGIVFVQPRFSRTKEPMTTTMSEKERAYLRMIKRVEFVFANKSIGTQVVEQYPFEKEFVVNKGVDVLVIIVFRSALNRPPAQFSIDCNGVTNEESLERVEFKPELLRKVLHIDEEESDDDDVDRTFAEDVKTKKKKNSNNNNNVYSNLEIENDDDDDEGDNNRRRNSLDNTNVSGSKKSNDRIKQTPADPNSWTIDDVAHWLESNQLSFLTSRFIDQDVDGYVLLRLTDQDVLKDLRVTSHVQRLRLFRNIDALKASRIPFEEKQNPKSIVSLERETREKLNVKNEAKRNSQFNTPVDLLEADVSWLQFVLPTRRLTVLAGWLSHVVDEVIDRFNNTNNEDDAKKDTIAAQISVYCVSAVKAELDIPVNIPNTNKKRILESLETVRGWSKKLELFDDAKTLDLSQLQSNLTALYLLLKEEEEEDEHESLSNSEGYPSPSVIMNSAATTMDYHSRSISPGAHHLRHVSSVMELAEECEIRYEDIEFSTGDACESNRIGRGGFGEVFLGRYNGSLVAVKRLFETPVGKGLDEFKREVSVLSTLRHPSIVMWLGACTVAPNTAIILEYMDRGSLHDVLHRSETNLMMSTRVRWSISIAKAMAYLHTHKPHAIIHCDLNCNNVLVNRDGAVKITDFGLSKVKMQSKATRQTGVTGTVSYAAPEVIVGNTFTEKSDVFSYGITVWEIISRTIPWNGLTEYQIVYRMSQENPESAYAACNNHLKMDNDDDGNDGDEQSGFFADPLKELLRSCWLITPEQRPKMGDILVKMIEIHKLACIEERSKRERRNN